MSTSFTFKLRRRLLISILHALWSSVLLWLGWRLLKKRPVRSGLRKVRLGIREEIESARGSVIHSEIGKVFVRSQQGTIYALSMQCTHGKCTVEYHSTLEQFFCPCHGGVFDREGNVVNGPPRRPLVRLPLRVEGETVYVLEQTGYGSGT